MDENSLQAEPLCFIAAAFFWLSVIIFLTVPGDAKLTLP